MVTKYQGGGFDPIEFNSPTAAVAVGDADITTSQPFPLDDDNT